MPFRRYPLRVVDQLSYGPKISLSVTELKQFTKFRLSSALILFFSCHSRHIASLRVEWTSKYPNRYGFFPFVDWILPAL